MALYSLVEEKPQKKKLFWFFGRVVQSSMSESILLSLKHLAVKIVPS